MVAKRFLEHSRVLALPISPKSGVVTNVAGIGWAIRAVCLRFGVRVNVVGGGVRDLGVLCQASRRRSLSLVQPRLANMRMRFRTLKGMHNFDPQARILLRGGCFAAGLYGCEVIGVAP